MNMQFRNVNQNKTCAFITLGCKVNQYDTQAIREQLLLLGYREVPPEQPADVYVVNTCTVTSISDTKGRKYIRRALRLNPRATVVVTGCSVDSDPELFARLAAAAEGRLIAVRNSAKLSIPSLFDAATPAPPAAAEAPAAPAPPAADTWSAGISAFEGHTRAFVKIEDGCDNFCAYCIVPYVRGRVRSRPMQSILDEAERLADAGFKEVVLTGIHVGAYGRGLDGVELADVIERLDRIPGITRLRLSSIEAMEVSERLINLAAGSKLCPHFHLPLQSGSDAVLSRMNRRYAACDFASVVERIRRKIPRASISTDVLLGFPGETEADYLETERMCKQVGFSRTHVFPYSERPGTASAAMSGKCEPAVIADRKRRLAGVARETAHAYRKQFAGEDVEVLVESQRDARGRLCGYTREYIRVEFDGPDDLMGRLPRVRLGSSLSGSTLMASEWHENHR
ncbi:MAG TPA: tRNA (N(6)-L-threonylcarbamoyladenosine(37)-C(2))-methylthiotransferase MtaB [Planctomycetota bacterium]|nr:tRNA (N(6)-L-threonylcarbamoyladenosine(37)-C(2))-methylthiotransferase MtaB [Planctomycetota bacterium]